jgi:hypothetical protein
MNGEYSELVGGFVVAGKPAGRAVVETIFAEADINLALAQAAVLFARAALLAQVALRTYELRLIQAGSGFA